MQDLSHLAANSLATDSQHAGNQVWPRNSMSAPGGASGDLGDQPNAKVVVDHTPQIEMQPLRRPGEDGKPQASGQTSYNPGPLAWGKTTTPDTVRTPPGGNQRNG